MSATLTGTGWLVDQIPAPVHSLPPVAWASLPPASANAGMVTFVTDVGVPPGIQVVSDGTRWIPMGSQCLARNAVAVILPSSGSSNASGQITHTTALPAQPAGTVLVFLPAGVVTAGSQGTGAGFYSAVYSSTTVCQLTGTGIVTANAAYTQSTAEQTLSTTSVPAGAMGINGGLDVRSVWTYSNTAGSKTMRLRLGGTALRSSSRTTQQLDAITETVRNRGSASSQVTASGFSTLAGAGIVVATSIDTTAAQALTLTGQLAVATDFIILEQRETWLLP